MIVAQALQRGCRTSDVPGRFGGDEFLVVCADLGRAEAGAVAERVRRSLTTASMTTPSALVRVSASVGLAWTAPGGTRPSELLARADAAVYDAKSHWNARRGGVGTAVPAHGAGRPLPR